MQFKTVKTPVKNLEYYKNRYLNLTNNNQVFLDMKREDIDSIYQSIEAQGGFSNATEEQLKCLEFLKALK